MSSLINPILSFETIKESLTKDINENLKKFKTPTPIQSVTWPPLMQGRDLVGIAKTGSGKTMAFGIPGLVHLQKKMEKSKSSRKKPRVLVLSPTRELAIQIEEQFILFGNSASCSSVCIYGGIVLHKRVSLISSSGVPKRPQQDKLRAGCDVIIATRKFYCQFPLETNQCIYIAGRLIDLFEENDQLCDLSKVSYLVLDEADRMVIALFVMTHLYLVGCWV